jgi:hypothetical protein
MKERFQHVEESIQKGKTRKKWPTKARPVVVTSLVLEFVAALASWLRFLHNGKAVFNHMGVAMKCTTRHNQRCTRTSQRDMAIVFPEHCQLLDLSLTFPSSLYSFVSHRDPVRDPLRGSS